MTKQLSVQNQSSRLFELHLIFEDQISIFSRVSSPTAAQQEADNLTTVKTSEFYELLDEFNDESS